MIDVRHIAKLSRLSIEEEKLDKFQKEMQDMVDMVEHLPALDGGAAQLDPANPMELRTDEVRPSLRREKVLENAPQTAAGCVVVPKTVE